MTTPVTALRSTWRTTAEQRAAQLWRILRLFLLALAGQVIAQLTANGFDLDKISHLDQKAVVALLIGAGEAAWRQLHPALTASAVDTAPGATIVPEQVGAPAAEPDLPEAPDDTLDVSTIPADLPDSGQGELVQILIVAAGVLLGLILFAVTGIQITPP